MEIHFIGIGGIGVSALAQYYLANGNDVSGSDLVSSEMTDYLSQKGIKITIGEHRAENLPSGGVSLTIFSPAVKPENPEYIAAKKLSVKIQSYPEALGELTKNYYTIAVSGTHGKSTTTAMLALTLEKAGLDPTIIIGTKIKELDPPAGGTNFKAGKSKFLVIEADEHFASFLNYWPQIIVLNNIEREHLDYYKNLNNVLKTYKKYVSHLPSEGHLVVNGDDKNIAKILNSKILTTRFKIKQKEAIKIKKILKVPGKHNVCNGLAVLSVARILDISDKITLKALSEFKGTWRRFDLRKATLGGKTITLISDYGHHPTEINATLLATREKFPKKQIWCVFQPHQHQRTHYLYKGFVSVFKKASASRRINNVIITDIYDVAGRETKAINKATSSEKLVKSIKKKNVIYVPINDVKKYLEQNIKRGDVLLIMGAGNIYDLTKEIL
jgi:UDP-N-acetylmuramate--alanine ligase